MAEEDDYQIKRCQEHANFWLNLEANNSVDTKTSTVKVFPTVLDAIEFTNQHSKCDILITGSLHLIGSALSVIHDSESQKLSSHVAF